MKKTGSIIWKIFLGIIIVAVILGGMGLAYRMGRLRNTAMVPAYGFTDRTGDEDCPMYDDEDDTDGAVIPDPDDRYCGGMMGGRSNVWGRGGMMGGRGGWFGMMPFGHGFFPLGGLLGGLLFIGLIVLVVRLLIGGPRWHRHFHGWNPHPMHLKDCPYCQANIMHDQHNHTGEKEVVEEQELNIDED